MNRGIKEETTKDPLGSGQRSSEQRGDRNIPARDTNRSIIMAARKSKKGSGMRSLVWKETGHFGRYGRQSRKGRLRSEAEGPEWPAQEALENFRQESDKIRYWWQDGGWNAEERLEQADLYPLMSTISIRLWN